MTPKDQLEAEMLKDLKAALEKSEDPSERHRSNALFADVVKRRAGFLSFQLEGEGLQKEIGEFVEAVLFASQHGDLFVSSYLDSIRQACEEQT